MGSVIEPGCVLTFKQCDLPGPARFLEPVRRRGHGDLWYLAFKRRGGHGPWAGVNNRGVAFVAADAYLDEETEDMLGPIGNVFEGYARIVAEHTSAASVVDYMLDFYEERGAPDILLVSDLEGAYLIEHSPVDGTRIAHHPVGHFAATNHYRMLPGAVDSHVDRSTYARLARAEEILDGDASLDGIHTLLSDQEFGETEMSICRVAEEPGEYHTQAAVIFRVEDGRIDCSYLLNGNPRSRPFSEWQDVFAGR